MNIFIVGAKKEGAIFSEDVQEWNNIQQACHSDLINLIDILQCDIICYDLAYHCSKEVDNIKYINEIFDMGNTDAFSKDKLNIIIEFCNMLDENYINQFKESNRKEFERLHQINRRTTVRIITDAGSDIPVEYPKFKFNIDPNFRKFTNPLPR